jgi:hypothetical protein
MTRKAKPGIGKTLKGAVGDAASAVVGAASLGFGAAKEVSGKVAGALPSRGIMKVVVGKALVTGGKALIDPRAAVGELALKLGEGMLADASELHWFVVRIDDHGHATTFPFVKRAEAERFFNETSREHPRQYLCERVAGPRG